MISRRILGLASAVNEAAIAYHDSFNATPPLPTKIVSPLFDAFTAANRLAIAVDALTGAIVEEANQ